MPERKKRLEQTIRNVEPAIHTAFLLGGLSVRAGMMIGVSYVQRTAFRSFKILYATTEAGERMSNPDAEDLDLIDTIIEIHRSDPASFFSKSTTLPTIEEKKSTK